jgi:Zn finger protein HypA/HybF involved in hydrogenase expression
MHEYAEVEAVVRGTIAQLTELGCNENVLAVRFSIGSTISENIVRQAFAAVSIGTILENAEVQIEKNETVFRCPCGYEQIVTNENLVGHLFLCPSCDQIHDIGDDAHDLKLIEVTVQDDALAPELFPRSSDSHDNYTQ